MKIIKIIITGCILFISGCNKSQSVSDDTDSGYDSETDSETDEGIDTCEGVDGTYDTEAAKEIDWVKINAGSFVFGSPWDTPFRDDSAEEEVNVTLTHDFMMAKTEVTQYQWQQVEGEMPDQLWYGDNLPVTMINFYDAAKYCNDLSIKEGYEPCYDLTSCKGDFAASCTFREADKNFQACSCPFFADDIDWTCNLNGVLNRNCFCDTVASGIYYCYDDAIHVSDNWYECEGYRLPTTAEWEYAAKAGTTTHTYGGDVHGDPRSLCVDEESLDDIAWYCYNSCDTIHPAGKKEPNNLGLYDMLGNVNDIVDYFTDGLSIDYMDGHPGEDLIDPQGRTLGHFKDIRGGSFHDIGELTRASWQEQNEPDEKESIVGFRPVRTLFKK